MASSKKFFVDIDLQGNGLNNSTVGTNADMTKAGSFQYDSTANRLQYFNGATIETVANLNDITGALDFQGGYDAATNTPDLTAPAAGAVKQGYYWVVTVEGTFFGEALAVGDSLFAKVDDPASLADWTLVQGNVDLATESVAGITYLASAAQVATGTETSAYAVNPATLQGKIKAQTNRRNIATGDWTLVGDTYEASITHNLNTPFPFVMFYNAFEQPVELGFYADSNNTGIVYSNILPDNDIKVIVATNYYTA